MSDFRAKIVAELDTFKIPSQLSKIEKQKIALSNFSIDTKGLTAKIQSALNGHQFTLNLGNVKVDNFSKTITGQMRFAGEQAGQRFSDSFNRGLSSINTTTSNAANTIQHMQRTLASMKFDRSSIDLVTKDLQNMSLAISNVTTRINGNSLNLSIKGVDELGRAVTIVKQFDYESGRISTIGKTISQSFDTGAAAAKRFEEYAKKATTALSSGSIDASIAKVTLQYEKLGSTGHAKLTEIKADIQQLSTLQAEMSNSKDTSSLVSNYERFVNVLTRVKNNLSVVSSETKQFASALQVATLQNKMETWLSKNTKATKTYGSTVQWYINELKTLSAQGNVSAADLQRLSSAFQQVDQAATAAGLKGKSFGDSLKGAVSSITRYIGASTLIYASFRAIRIGITDVIDLDTALIDLQKTAKATTSEINAFYLSSNDTAKSLGVTTKEVIQAAADWSRLGYSLKDAQTMAEVSSIFTSISPGMDIEKATDGLVSTMKAFDIEADEALDGIASKINAIGNSQAVTNNDIVDFLTRSSSAMKEANNTLEQTIALGTAATEITRDAESVGNALKTVSMRIRGYDEETEEFIGGIEILDGDIANLTKTADNSGGISLFTDESKSEYKSTYQLLKDISEIYDKLSDKKQAKLLEKLAGKRQGQIVASILNNFQAVENSLKTMENSDGSAMREMAVIEESLEFKLNALKETGTSIWQNLFPREGLGNAISVLTGILEVIDALTSGLGLLGTLAVGGGIAAFIKNFGRAYCSQTSYI